MSLIELIAFAISIIAFLYLSIRNTKALKKEDSQKEKEYSFDNPLDFLSQALEEEKRKQQEQKKEKQKKTQVIKKNGEVFPKKLPPQPLIKEQDPYKSIGGNFGTFKSSIESRQLQSEVEKRKLKSEIEKRKLKLNIKTYRRDKMEHDYQEALPSLGENTLKELPSLKKLIILDAILNEPKGW